MSGTFRITAMLVSCLILAVTSNSIQPSATVLMMLETEALDSTTVHPTPTPMVAPITCPPGSVPSPCPEMPQFQDCFPENSLCDLVSECANGADESNCNNHVFVPFGEAVGDRVGPSLDDASIMIGILDAPIAYYQEKERDIYFSTNGMISLREKYANWNPLDKTTLLIIAPLWVDLHFEMSGTIYYRITNDSSTLNLIRGMIRDINEELEDYVPTQAVIVTWFEPRASNIMINIYLNTFQAVLLTNGNESFAIFLYQSPLSVVQIISDPHSLVGFRDSTGVNAVNFLVPEQINIFRIDGSCITKIQQEKVCGLEATATECARIDFKASECTCRDSGYQYQGSSCIDLNECDADPCARNSDCLNTDGSFECVCSNGYLQNNGSDCIAEEDSSPNPAADTGSVLIGTLVTTFFLLIIFNAAFVLFICCIYYQRKKKRKMRKLSLSELDTGREYFQQLKQMSMRSSLKIIVPNSMLISSCNLKLGKSVGQGEFGIVYRALLKKGFDQEFSETVAVKTLKGFLDRELVKDLLRECAKMQDFNHPNILQLRGVCLDGGPAPYIIMPFMNNGSLLSHLKNERKLLVIDPDIEHSPEDIIEVAKKLVGMCIQVAKGMEYLTSKRVIHRDLAARNCMIDVNFIIKVADFGFSETIDPTKDYFKQEQENSIKLPVKWLAPESIHDGKFSEKTDVWAFGVTCWEVFSGGKAPYPGIHPRELFRQLETGYRMEKPYNSACTDEIYDSIRCCWIENPDLRPPFSRLVTDFASYLEAMADYLIVRGPDIMSYKHQVSNGFQTEESSSDDVTLLETIKCTPV